MIKAHIRKFESVDLGLMRRMTQRVPRVLEENSQNSKIRLSIIWVTISIILFYSALTADYCLTTIIVTYPVKLYEKKKICILWV